MLFKRETDYGIRIVRALKDGNKLAVRDICEREDIPEAFAYKILGKLQKAGVVLSERGAQGGYRLGRGTDQLTLYDILLAVEPDFAVIPCMHESCSQNTTSSPCKVHCELIQIQEKIVKELSGNSMKQILQDKRM